MVDHENTGTETEIEDIELSEELSELETATPDELDYDEEEEEESAGGLFGFNIFTKRNLFYLALVALAVVAIVCLCQGNDQYGCDTVNAYTPSWAANMLGETSSDVEGLNLDNVAELSATSGEQ
mgnify:CR=1 FL=1|tara:strand:+ start:2021 stop:2392 length:372 start_codon:yes stop_codon:yes gene_type:complete